MDAYVFVSYSSTERATYKHLLHPRPRRVAPLIFHVTLLFCNIYIFGVFTSMAIFLHQLIQRKTKSWTLGDVKHSKRCEEELRNKDGSGSFIVAPAFSLFSIQSNRELSCKHPRVADSMLHNINAWYRWYHTRLKNRQGIVKDGYKVIVRNSAVDLLSRAGLDFACSTWNKRCEHAHKL